MKAAHARVLNFAADRVDKLLASETTTFVNCAVKFALSGPNVRSRVMTSDFIKKRKAQGVIATSKSDSGVAFPEDDRSISAHPLSSCL